jgi:hypothetical protein
MKSGFIAGALVPALGQVGNDSQAANHPPLSPSDPQAKTLGFTPDAAKIDTSVHPTYKPGQRCGTCQQYQGKATDAMAGCTIFAGHSVPASGWCMVWTQRSQ